MNGFNDGKWRRASLKFIVCLSLVGTVTAQMPPDCRQDAGNQPCDASSNPIRVQSPLVILPITVTDPAGNPVLDLKKGEFRVLDDDTPQKITSLSIRMQPVAAVIVIQSDEGVAPLVNQIHPLGILFSNLLLGQPGEAAVITYADKVRLIQGFSGALELSRAALRRDALQQYAEFTGGVVYKHWKARTVQDHLQKIAVEVNSEYTLTYVPTTLNKTGFHPILVEVSKPRLKVRTRAGYFYGPTVK